ncbi:MAG: MDR family MFS transporter [Tuberibacillus sp.]
MKALKMFHPIVTSLLLGTIMVRAASFMAMPFLAIYLTKTTEMNPVLIGLVIGMGPLTSTFGSFIGGTLSDMIGRKKLMFSALFIYGMVFVGFATASAPWIFLVLNAVNGLCRSFFEPTSQALMSDLTPKEKRVRLFSLRYTAINVGATVGPLLGALLGSIAANLAFFITAAVYFIYLVSLIVLFLVFPVNQSDDQSGNKITFLSATRVIAKDKALLYFILAGICINLGYSQVESTLPQYLKDSLSNGVLLYSVLLSLNAVTVVVLQVLLMRLIEKLPMLKGLIIGTLLFSLGYLGFALSHGWVMFIISMIVLTLGEIFVFPMGGVIIDRLATDELRGTYFGANGFRSIGFFVGPWLGGLLFDFVNGAILYFVTAAVVLFSIVLYTTGYRKMVQREGELAKLAS